MVVISDYNLNNDITLGAKVCGDVLTVAFCVKAKECNLQLWIADEVYTVPMVQLRNGLFAQALQLSMDEKENFSYCFIADGAKYLDPYSKRIFGRESFGVAATELRSGLSDFDEVWTKDEMKYKKHRTSDLVLYKLHVRSFTKGKSSGVKHPGSFKGVTEKIHHMEKLGISGVLLQPIVDFDEQLPNGMVNFWGYNCKNTFYFAPKTSFSATNQPCNEFAEMVEKLHKADIDVYLEMIFDSSVSQSMMLDVLRFYHNYYHVDGFRINECQVNIDMLLSDAYLSEARFFVTYADERMIDEYSERLLCMNEQFMNDMRKYIKGDEGMVPALFDYMKNRNDRAAVKYITDHNGFTLNDLYSYDVRHNDANMLGGTDGSDMNYSWNCGIEGDTRSKKIKTLRAQMIKNALTVTILSGGVPMLVAGDEFLHSKQGNNNSFCQDNDISYLDWKGLSRNKEILEYVRFLISFRRENECFTAKRILSESDYAGVGFPEISFHGVSPWRVDYQAYNRLAGVFISGKFRNGENLTEGEDIYLIFNMHWVPHEFSLPERRKKSYYYIADTSKRELSDKSIDKSVVAEPRSIIILGCK